MCYNKTCYNYYTITSKTILELAYFCEKVTLSENCNTLQFGLPYSSFAERIRDGSTFQLRIPVAKELCHWIGATFVTYLSNLHWRGYIIVG